MKIGVLGTGMVGRAHSARLSQLGHDVFMGTRDVDRTLGVTATDAMGNPPLSGWLAANEGITLVTFSAAADAGEIVIEGIAGSACLSVLSGLQRELNGKLLVDIANPLAFEDPVPSLSVSNTDSLAEQIQRALPATKVVKTLNTVTAALQVDPGRLADGDHDVFVSGDDRGAKDRVIGMLKDWYGWKNVIDLGDITSARAAEMYMPLWLRLWGVIQAPAFNIKVVHPAERTN